jgi:hypothetical protein
LSTGKNRKGGIFTAESAEKGEFIDIENGKGLTEREGIGL